MEEETISMTMEEDNNQYNPIEINDNKIYNNYVMSIENEEDDDKDSTRVEARLADENMRLEEEEKKRLAEKKKKITKGEKKRLVEKEEENNKNEKRVKELKSGGEYERERRNRNTKEEILTLYKCFALKLFERKIRCQLKEEIIERLIQEIEIKINDINEYKEIIKKTFKIKNENKREINRIMDEEIIKHQWKDNELKEIISKMNKKEEIEEDEVMKIIKEEEMKE
ncbi:hypothetical protein ENUP19_0188G0029 [Entamoeba nuttalli]|uniref:Uncharacterized protein n=1 Tax=Entamoeba nuttalli TaxID=412467 RepID=A0ABQ0DN82_9EUKA